MAGDVNDMFWDTFISHIFVLLTEVISLSKCDDPVDALYALDVILPMIHTTSALAAHCWTKKVGAYINLALYSMDRDHKRPSAVNYSFL